MAIPFTPHTSRCTVNAQQVRQGARRPCFGSPGQRLAFALKPHASGGTVNTQQVQRGHRPFFLVRQTRAWRLLETFHVTGHAPITRTPRHPLLPRPIPPPRIQCWGPGVRPRILRRCVFNFEFRGRGASESGRTGARMFGIGSAFVFANSVSIVFFRELTHAVDEKTSRNKSGSWATC